MSLPRTIAVEQYLGSTETASTIFGGMSIVARP